MYASYTFLKGAVLLPKLIYRFSVIPIKTPDGVFVEILQKSDLKIQTDRQWTQNCQNNLEEEQSGRLDFFKKNPYPRIILLILERDGRWGAGWRETSM